MSSLRMVGVLKKRVETNYLEEARRASTIFPTEEPVAGERPDFVFNTASGRLGIEVTELCREAPRAEAGRLANVAPRAKALYTKRPGAHSVDVSPAFSDDASHMKVGILAKALADFVYVHRDADTNFDWPDVPEGYIHIGVFPADNSGGKWRYFRVFNTVSATQELLGARIAEKESRVSDYRTRTSEIWLLVVNDLFIGPGEVHVRAEDVGQWTFPFTFDKVLLFSRQPGGSGSVFELRRG